MTKPALYTEIDRPNLEILKLESIIEQVGLMLDVFNRGIEIGIIPKRKSPYHKKVLELLKLCGRGPTTILKKTDA